MAPPPPEIQHAEEAIMEGNSKLYMIIPSKSALKDASALGLNVAPGDIPLFIADRLAFAGSKGAQVCVCVCVCVCTSSTLILSRNGHKYWNLRFGIYSYNLVSFFVFLQLPLFLEKSDCLTSYSRLREAGGNRLPETPTIRTSTLLDVLYSMEKGTRPGVSQLAFYASADDLVQATERIML